MCLHSTQQMPCLEKPIWQAGISDISSNVKGVCCMERILWVPFGGLGTSASKESYFICLPIPPLKCQLVPYWQMSGPFCCMILGTLETLSLAPPLYPQYLSTPLQMSDVHLTVYAYCFFTETEKQCIKCKHCKQGHMLT